MKSEFRISNSEVPISAGVGLCLLLAAVLAGCAVGPNYKRPESATPESFRRAASDTNVFVGTNSFADLGWWETFNDAQLTAYIEEALTNSWDVKIAAARVLQ